MGKKLELREVELNGSSGLTRAQLTDLGVQFSHTIDTFLFCLYLLFLASSITSAIVLWNTQELRSNVPECPGVWVSPLSASTDHPRPCCFACAVPNAPVTPVQASLLQSLLTLSETRNTVPHRTENSADTLENSLAAPQSVEHRVTISPSNSIPSINPRQIITYVHTKICTQM